MIIDDKVIMPPPPPYPDSPYTYDRPSQVPLYNTQAQAQLQGQGQPQQHSHSPAGSSYGSRSTLTLPLPTSPSRANLANLPAHIHLQIIHHTFPYSKPQLPTYSSPPPDDGYNSNSNYNYGYATPDTLAERQRRTLLWLSTSLRLVNRALYIACMHVLRSTYLPAYLAMVKSPYTSDPFPMGVSVSASSTSTTASSSSSAAVAGPPAYASPPSSTPTRPPQSPSYHQPSSSHSTYTSSPLQTPHREPPILDRFIALKIRSDVLLDESSLHLSREDAFRDLFDVEQPRARLEDLVREEGVRRGVVWVGPCSGYEMGYGNGGGRESRYEEGEDGGGVSKTTTRPLGMSNPAGSSSSSSLQILREVDAQIEARRAYNAARAQVQAQFSQSHSQSQSRQQPQAQVTKKSSFFSFRRSPASPTSSSHPSSSSYSTSHQTQTQNQNQPPPPPLRPIPFHFLSISFAPRRIGLVLARTRTIAEVPRNPTGTVGRGGTAGGIGGRETLEVLAGRIVDVLGREMGGW